MRFEILTEEIQAQYEKHYFEKICCVSVGDRSSFSTPLPQFEGMRFACMQDTVERLTEIGSGRLSALQWRNFVFVPVDKSVKPRDIYLEVFDRLRDAMPSIFIRAYVYVVFVTVYGSGSLAFGELGDNARRPRTEDFHTYEWNTNQDIVRTSPSKMAEIGRPRAVYKDEASEGNFESGRDDARGVKYVDRVFLVADPKAELQRIQDANSDVIDAVKAFTGNLGLVKQTEDALREIERALKEPGSRVLLQGPARSGKTIIAMSLLANDPSAKMLLMNRYFYEALKDAFKVWARQDEADIVKLFEPSYKLREKIGLCEANIEVLEAYESDPRTFPALLEMWQKKIDTLPLAHWKMENGKWLVERGQNMAEGEIVYVHQKSGGVVQIQVVEEVLENGLARCRRLLPKGSLFGERPVGRPGLAIPGTSMTSSDVPNHLAELQRDAEKESIAKAIAAQIKAISLAIEASEQRFFHHDRRKKEGLWVEVDRPLITDSSTLICDEAQRLGTYADLDECEWVRERKGRTFLCGDDNQRLNRRGDEGIAPILEGRDCCEFHLPDSIGIPREIEAIVKAMLGDGEVPKAPKSFSIKLLHDDDLGLVSSFERDRSGKKHYAIPMSTGFYNANYLPYILKSTEMTGSCTEECKEKYCTHRYVRALSPLSDPDRMPKRDDLGKSYKFFCAEAIMPNYALSAYELISREVESIYLKIPKRIGEELLSAKMDGDSTMSWIKRHLYVLMTRATANLVINVEDDCLYEAFKRVCEKAGIDYRDDASVSQVAC